MIVPTDNEIKKILLRNATTFRDRNAIIMMEAVEEERVDNVMVSKLYKLAIDKAHIDFDNIPDTKGDITKYVGYTNMVDSLALVKDLAKQNNTKIKEIEIVEQAIQNIVTYRAQFTKGFLIDKEFIILLYNLLVTACVEATSVIIASYVDFIKSPTKVEFTIIKGANKMGHTSIKSLNSFNLSVKSGDFSKVINTISNDKENLLGTATAGALIPIMILGGLSMIVPLLRELTYYFFYSRMKTSDFLKHQAQLLEINRESVKNSNLPPSKKKEVLRKQAQAAKIMTDYADKIAVDSRGTEKMVKSEIEKENKTITIKDVQSQASTLDTSGFIL